MPLSSQIEYRRLINRISLLEKKKLTKLKIYTPNVQPAQAISVTISNDQHTMKPLKNTNRIISSKPPVDSLVKQVLVKNITKNQKIDSKELLVNFPKPTNKCESTNQLTKEEALTTTSASTAVLSTESKTNLMKEEASVTKKSIAAVVPADTVQAKPNKILNQFNVANVVALTDIEKAKVLSQTEIQYAAHR